MIVPLSSLPIQKDFYTTLTKRWGYLAQKGREDGEDYCLIVFSDGEVKVSPEMRVEIPEWE